MICTLNGIGVSAATTTDRIARRLEGYYKHHVCRLEYRPTYWYTARNRGKQFGDAAHLLEQVNHARETSLEPVDLVAHSHGCLLASRMMELSGDYPFRVVWLFAPALDRAWMFPFKGAREIHVVFNPHDRAILMARLAPLNHPWGGMGRYGWTRPVGYMGPVVMQHKDTTKQWPRSHSHYFTGTALNRWAEAVHQTVT